MGTQMFTRETFNRYVETRNLIMDMMIYPSDMRQVSLQEQVARVLKAGEEVLQRAEYIFNRLDNQRETLAIAYDIGRIQEWLKKLRDNPSSPEPALSIAMSYITGVSQGITLSYDLEMSIESTDTDEKT